MTAKLSVDEFLKAQKTAPTRAVLDAADGTTVRITPLGTATDCNCAATLVLPKTAIASVTPLDELHQCCGLPRKVALVEFAPNVAELMVSILAQAQPTQQQAEISARRPRDYCVKLPDGTWICFSRDDYWSERAPLRQDEKEP